MSQYFTRFEHRRPKAPVAPSLVVETVWQFAATVNILLGCWYLWWRWTASLNPTALWFSIPLVVAETLAFVGTLLFTYNLWRVEDTPREPPPANILECGDASGPGGPIAIDIFITTMSESEEIVRLSVRDAHRLTYPFPLDVNIAILDDGRRPEMAVMAAEEGVRYITRPTNIGFKAGNLRNAMEQTTADFIVICDADTRLFPTFLANTLGYFRDADVAFVQTPHWFYDLPEGRSLVDVWQRRAGRVGATAANFIQRIVGPVRIGVDPFCNDPTLFFDIILRRRNRVNAVFCCGAASIHRREAVMFVAISQFVATINRQVDARPIRERLMRLPRVAARDELARWLAAQKVELTPYKFHVSEDIYSSIMLHQDRDRRWKSVLHPAVEARMLSPQDLLSWSIQRYKYAAGSLDIFLRDNPVAQAGLSLPQKVMYLATFYSYIGAIWNLVFLAAPIVYFTTGIAPVTTYTTAFLLHVVPFLIANEVATMLGTWGTSDHRSKMVYLASFPISLRALTTVLLNQPIRFEVTPKIRQDGQHWRLIWPQIAIIAMIVITGGIGLWRFAHGDQGFTEGGVTINGLWSIYNIIALSTLVTAAWWRPNDSTDR